MSVLEQLSSKSERKLMDKRFFMVDYFLDWFFSLRVKRLTKFHEIGFLVRLEAVALVEVVVVQMKLQRYI